MPYPRSKIWDKDVRHDLLTADDLAVRPVCARQSGAECTSVSEHLLAHTNCGTEKRGKVAVISDVPDR